MSSERNLEPTEEIEAGRGQCRGSGSGRIGIILADPNPFQLKVKLNYRYIFKDNINILSKIFFCGGLECVSHSFAFHFEGCLD
jgi:hypothetical protein